MGKSKVLQEMCRDLKDMLHSLQIPSWWAVGREDGEVNVDLGSNAIYKMIYSSNEAERSRLQVTKQMILARIIHYLYNSTILCYNYTSDRTLSTFVLRKGRLVPKFNGN